MKLHYFLMIILFGASCQSDSATYDIKDYICPDLGNHHQLFYEYENNNESFSNIKYMMIEKDSLFDNHYSYIFMDKQFDKVSGYHEIREEFSTKFDEMIFLELGINNEKIINEVTLFPWEMPFLIQMNKTVSFFTKWNSKIQDDIKYSIDISRKLIDTTGYYNYQNQEISTIRFQANETLKSIQTGKVLQEITTESSFAYGLGKGVVSWNIRSEDDFVSFKLKAIYAEEEFEELMIEKG